MVLPLAVTVLMVIPVGWLMVGSPSHPSAVPTGGTSAPSALGAAVASLDRGEGPAAVAQPFAGQGSGGGENETTSYNGTWLTTSLNRWGGGVAYDPEIGSVVVAGGSFQGASEVSYLGDTWYFQNGNWTHTYITSSMSVRGGIAMTYDARDHSVLMFGGIRGGHTLSENWVFQYGTWTLLKPSVVPAPRIWASMAFDAADNTVVLFGGYSPASGSSGGGSYFSDTWYYSGGTWTQLLANYGPSPRDNASLAYDPALGALVLFGGNSPSGALADTWTFSHGIWTDVTTTVGAPVPPARGAAAMAWDDADHEIVMMGGQGSSGLLGDAWAFRGGHWTTLPAGPSARFGAMMAYDPQVQAIVLFGGGSGTTALGDTWYFQGTWTQVTPGGSISGRTGATTVEIPATGETLLFGGWSGAGYLGDTWIFDHGAWSLAASLSAGPTARMDAGLAYVQTGPNATDGYVVMFGGFNGAYLNDAWAYANGTWTAMTMNGTPTPRDGMVFQSSGTTPYAFLYGGLGSTGYLSDTWEFNGLTGNWTAVTNSGTTPAARAFAAATLDPGTNSVLLFGGQDRTGYLSDTWEVTLPEASGSATWTESSSHGPTERSNATLTWVPMYPYNGGVLVGGTDSENVALNDYWGFNAGTWTLYPTPLPGGGGGSGGENTTEVEATSPMPRAGGVAFYSAADGYLTYFGGQTSAGVQGDSWSLILFLAQPTGSSGLADSGTTVQFHGALFGGTKPFTYAWTFGDDTTSTSATPTHVFSLPNGSGPETYTNSLVVTDASGITSTRSFDTVVYPALVVNWSVGNRAADVGVPFTFASNVSGGAPPVKVFWDFGTGERYFAYNGSYTFLAAGNHTVTFHAVSGGGSSYQNTTLVSVVPPPSAEVRTSHIQTDVGVPVAFTADVRNGVGPHRYHWSFGDGQISSDPIVAHTYTTVGTYNVSLSVNDTYGQVTAAATIVTVNERPSIVSVVAIPAVTDVGYAVRFTGDGVGGTGNLSWNWSFGDGALSTPNDYNYDRSFDLNHTYDAPGTYRVSVWANDTLGVSANSTATVLVMPLPTVHKFTANASSLTVGDTLTLTAEVSGGVTPYTYVYSNLPAGCVAADTPTIECTVNQAGDFSVTVYVTDAIGAQASKVVAVHVDNKPGLTLAGMDANTSLAILAVIVAAIAIAAFVVVRTVSKRRRAERSEAGAGSAPSEEPPTSGAEETVGRT